MIKAIQLIAAIIAVTAMALFFGRPEGMRETALQAECIDQGGRLQVIGEFTICH